MVLLVTWKLGRTEPMPMSGGHVVKEILHDALLRVGHELYVQGCNPGCTHDFAHTTIRFLPGPEGLEEVEFRDSPWFAEAEALVPSMPEEILRNYVYLDISLAVRDFTKLKNLARRILETEAAARSALGSLMWLNYKRAQLPSEPIGESLQRRWEMRGWRAESHRLIARVWLALAGIETLRRQWSADRFSFEDGLDTRGQATLFKLDYADEVDRVASLDLELMRSGVQEAAGRLDSGALLRVTAIAAVAGAVTGGLVGAVASNGF
jgi:hypothetical protein